MTFLEKLIFTKIDNDKKGGHSFISIHLPYLGPIKQAFLNEPCDVSLYESRITFLKGGVSQPKRNEWIIDSVELAEPLEELTSVAVIRLPYVYDFNYRTRYVCRLCGWSIYFERSEVESHFSFCPNCNGPLEKSVTKLK